MMAGDTNKYVKLLPRAESREPLGITPGELTIGKQWGALYGISVRVSI